MFLFVLSEYVFDKMYLNERGEFDRRDEIAVVLLELSFCERAANITVFLSFLWMSFQQSLPVCPSFRTYNLRSFIYTISEIHNAKDVYNVKYPLSRTYNVRSFILL